MSWHTDNPCISCRTNKVSNAQMSVMLSKFKSLSVYQTLTFSGNIDISMLLLFTPFSYTNSCNRQPLNVIFFKEQ